MGVQLETVLMVQERVAMMMQLEAMAAG